MPPTPKLVLDGDAVDAILVLPAAQRRRLLDSLDRLCHEHPYTSEDFHFADETGRHISIKAIRPVLVAYWLDGPVNELRITRITRVRPQTK